MNFGPFIFVGLFFTMSLSWLGFVLGPQLQLGSLTQTATVPGGETYPNSRPGLARKGAEIYRANGCAACHTQQVRPRELGSDLDRPLWGIRRSVAHDYVFDEPVMLGSTRIGPDLANVALRLDPNTMVHLYAPRAIEPNSVMPPYRFLFQKRKIAREPSADALKLPEKFAPEAGYEIVPTSDARALVGYLSSLRQTGIIFETPMPQPKIKQPQAAVAPAEANPGTPAPAK